MHVQSSPCQNCSGVPRMPRVCSTNTNIVGYERRESTVDVRVPNRFLVLFLDIEIRDGPCVTVGVGPSPSPHSAHASLESMATMSLTCTCKHMYSWKRQKGPRLFKGTWTAYNECNEEAGWARVLLPLAIQTLQDHGRGF